MGRPISWRQQRKRVAGLLDRLDIRLDPGTEIATLTRGERTLVAVARAICELEAGIGEDPEAEGRHLLIMDEPTAALSSTESGAVYELLRRVAADGGAALFISHHVQEVRGLCACITILRDGEVVGNVASAEATEGDIVRGMRGAELARETPLDPEAIGANGTEASSALPPAAARQPVLRVQDLQTDILRGMSFDVAPGEIVGITGLLGMGQDELPYVIAGARGCLAGSIEVDGRTIASGRLHEAIGAGVALVPAERRRDRLWMEASATGEPRRRPGHPASGAAAATTGHRSALSRASSLTASASARGIPRS